MVFGGRPLVALGRSLPGTFSASADFSSAGWAVNKKGLARRQQGPHGGPCCSSVSVIRGVPACSARPVIGSPSAQAGFGSRSYRRRDQTYDSTATPTHQAIVMIRLSPILVPVSRPRSVSFTGVNGWYSANQRTPAGSELVGTNPLPRNGRRMRNIGELLAVSTLLADRPRPTHSHVTAKVSRDRKSVV